MGETSTKSYYFMQFAEWYFVDLDWKIKLTNLGKSIPGVPESYEKYKKEQEVE